MPNFSGVWDLRQLGVAVQGDTWQGATTEGRAIFTAGTTGGVGDTDVLDFVDISTLANATDFGDLSIVCRFNGAMNSSTRGVIQLGGQETSSTPLEEIEYVTIASEGNSADFGDASQTRNNGIMSASNATRGINGGGYNSQSASYVAQVDYITIASQGDGQDFGDLSIARYGVSGLGSPTRALALGGAEGIQGDRSNHIDYRAIASLGDFVDFGDLNVQRRAMSAASNSTRGVVSGSLQASANINSIEYVTIATLGDGQDFGDLVNPSNNGAGAAGETRALLVRGNSSGTPSSSTSDIEYITIASLSNSLDFGDLSVAREAFLGQSIASNHGGLQT